MSFMNSLYLAVDDILTQLVFGLFFIGVVLTVNGFAFTEIISFFRKMVGRGIFSTKFSSTILFIMCAQLLAFTQFLSVIIWSVALMSVELSPDWLSAARFSASSYTTLGDFPVVMRDGWHFIPAFIAFSGFFSFAWAASSTVSMLNAFNRFFDAVKIPSN